MATSSTRRKIKSSRHRNDNGMWGYSPSSFSNRIHKRLVKAAQAGLIPMPTVTMTIVGRKSTGTKQPRPNPRAVGGPTIVGKVGGIMNSLFRRSGTRGSE